MLVTGSWPVQAPGLFPLKHFKETIITPFYSADGETEAQRSSPKQASGHRACSLQGFLLCN